MLQPLPFRDGPGSYLTVSIAPLTRPALPIPILQASSKRSTSCLSRQPHKPKLLPFAASVAPWAFSPPQTKRPQLHRECPALRGLTTTFRSTVCRHRDCADTRLRSSPSSGRPAAPATPSPEGNTKIKVCCAVVGRAVSHPQNAYCAHLRGQYQQPHPVRKTSCHGLFRFFVPFGGCKKKFFYFCIAFRKNARFAKIRNEPWK